MSQADVLAVLEQNPGRKMTSLEIAKKLKSIRRTVGVSLKRLRATTFINYELCKFTGRKMYRYWVDK